MRARLPALAGKSLELAQRRQSISLFGFRDRPGQVQDPFAMAREVTEVDRVMNI